MTALSMAASWRCWLLLLLTLTALTVTSSAQAADRDGTHVMSGIRTQPSRMRPRPVQASLDLSSAGNTSPRRSSVVYPDMTGLFGSRSNKNVVPGRETGEQGNNIMSERTNERQTAVMQLPEDMDMNKLDMNSMKTLSNLMTMEDFAQAFGVPLPSDDSSNYIIGAGGIAARSGSAARDSEVMAVGAKCEPEEKIVLLDLPVQLNVIYFPRCVRLMRCGGCCAGPLLKCQPTQFTPVTLKVMRVESSPAPSGRSAALRNGRPRERPDDSTRRERREASSAYQHVAEEHHTACECLCRVQEQDCKPALHDYMQNECRCRCKNREEQVKCESKPVTHYWDNDTCMCYCLSTDSCSTGQFFDHTICGCTNSQRLRAGRDTGA